MLSVVFFGNSESLFSNRHFEVLLGTPCQLAAVVDVPPAKRLSTNPAAQEAAPFVNIAKSRGVPAYEPTSPNLPEFITALSEFSPDLFLAAGYMAILKERILSVPRVVAANFHASLLPDYRGKHPVFWALRHGERWSGLTVHAMDAGIDTGDIFYQLRVRTRKDDTVSTLYDRIMSRSVGLVARLVDDSARGRIPRTPQPRKSGSYFSSVGEADFRLDWSWDAEKLRRWIASTPGQCLCSMAGRQVYLMGADALAQGSFGPPGALLRIGRSSCTVAAGAGALRLHQGRLADGEWLSMPMLCHRLALGPGDLLA